jgi:hypothetical protein
MTNPYIRRVGDLGIYHHSGDKVGEVYTEEALDDIITLMDTSEDAVNKEDMDLLEILSDNKLDETALKEVIEKAEKYDANVEHFDNMYETVSNMLVLQGWRDEELELINELAETLKQVDIKPKKKKKTKELKPAEADERMQAADKRMKERIGNHIQMCITSLQKLLEEAKT